MLIFSSLTFVFEKEATESGESNKKKINKHESAEIKNLLTKEQNLTYSIKKLE